MKRDLYPAQIRTMKRLVREECCNFLSEYNGINDACLLCEAPCEQINDDGITCQYFYDYVLCNDKDLCAQLISPDKTKRCASCGKTFSAGSNRAQYCDECGKLLRNKKTAERVRNHRDAF